MRGRRKFRIPANSESSVLKRITFLGPLCLSIFYRKQKSNWPTKEGSIPASFTRNFIIGLNAKELAMWIASSFWLGWQRHSFVTSRSWVTLLLQDCVDPSIASHCILGISNFTRKQPNLGSRKSQVTFLFLRLQLCYQNNLLPTSHPFPDERSQTLYELVGSIDSFIRTQSRT